MSGKRRFRPSRFDMLRMMGINLIVGGLLLKFVLYLFGISFISPMFHFVQKWLPTGMKWEVFWPLLPGMAIGYAGLWGWLVLTGRSTKLQWGGAFAYGVGIACADVVVGGFVKGLIQGNPFLGVLLALVSLLMLPSLAPAMAVFGLAMGAFNGKMAQAWIDKNRPKA